ncbi:hypothetical protein [Solicola sp. PLA-1-18]|uniref:hypothetical protein n=1 Tax=Solicola sp. PLA-1-18 TaxID=3380532 RepID=UPI003B821121
MARHVAEFLARPLDAETDQRMPPWVAEATTVVLGVAAVAFVAGSDLVAGTGLALVLLVVLFPLALGTRTDVQPRTPRFLVWTTNVAVALLVVAAGLALGLVVLPLAATLPLLLVTALPLLVRGLRALVRPVRHRRR